MQKAYYISGSGLYAGEPFSFLWPFSQALAATVTMTNVQGIASIPGLAVSLTRELHARLIGLNAYLDTTNSGAPEGTFTSTLAAFDGTVAPPAGPGGTKYYDDNDWVGIELARLYKLTHNAAALGSAEGIMAFEMAGWQTTDPSGERWPARAACRSRTPSKTPIATPSPTVPRRSSRCSSTGSPATFSICSSPRWPTNGCAAACCSRAACTPTTSIRKGVVEPMLWSYNQGTMIGAGTLLYQATGNGAYLYQARQTAKAALAYFTPERLGSEIPFFPSVYFRNLLYLDSVTHDPPGPKIAQAYVDYAWQNLRLSNNLFVSRLAASAQLLVQAAIVQIYALLSSPPSTYF